MAKVDLDRRVEILEAKMDQLRDVPVRLAAVESQIVLLRGDMEAGFSALLTKMRSSNDESRTGLRAEIRAMGEELRAEMRANSEELRAEMRANSEELRAEMRADSEELRTEMRANSEGLRAEMRVLNGKTHTQMRILHEEVMGRFALLHEGRSRADRGTSRTRKSR